MAEGTQPAAGRAARTRAEGAALGESSGALRAAVTVRCFPRLLWDALRLSGGGGT